MRSLQQESNWRGGNSRIAGEEGRLYLLYPWNQLKLTACCFHQEKRKKKKRERGLLFQNGSQIQWEHMSWGDWCKGLNCTIYHLWLLQILLISAVSVIATLVPEPTVTVLTQSGWTLTHFMWPQPNSICHMSIQSTSCLLFQMMLRDKMTWDHVCSAQKYQRINILGSKHLTNEKWEIMDKFSFLLFLEGLTWEVIVFIVS